MTQWIWKFRALAIALTVATGLAACDEDPIQPGSLLAPAGVQVSRVDSGVEISWSAVPGATDYTVEREVAGAGEGFVAIASGLAATRYTDATVSERNAYRYRVLAVRGDVRSEASDARPVTVCAGGTLCGTILAGDTLELAAGEYLMTGTVAVDSGAVLRIAAGTVIRGDTLVTPTALLVRQGGKIHAEGTAQQPIVFTSSRPEGRRARGDWGGIIIAGRSLCNFPAPCQAEGISTRYGGDVEDDDSGVLRYVRIEYAGYEASPGNELNGLTLAGVGSGTEIDHIQVHYGSDDGIEWFGGTVNVKYAIVTGSDDDSFDYSSGWQGKGQFWIVQQSATHGDKAFEVDGNELTHTATPLTDPQIYNLTLIGRGAGASGSNDAIQLRRGVRGRIHNAIILGWGGAALEVDDQATADHCAGATRLVDDVIYFDVAEPMDGDDDAFEAACAGEGFRNLDPQLVRALDRGNPDFRPAAGSAALSGAAAVPGDPFFTAVDYLGAVDPNGTPWYQGWTTFATL